MGPIEKQKELDAIRAKLKQGKNFFSAAQLRCFRVRRDQLIEDLKKVQPINPFTNEQSNPNSFSAHSKLFRL
jgi:hypothetical protein